MNLYYLGAPLSFQHILLHLPERKKIGVGKWGSPSLTLEHR